MTFDSVVALWEAAKELFGDTTSLEVDLDEVTHTDSAGLALLVEWLREARARQVKVSFHNLPPQMIAIARTSNLEHILGGEEEAEKTCSPRKSRS